MLEYDIKNCFELSELYLNDKTYCDNRLSEIDFDGMEFNKICFDGCTFLQCDFSKCRFYDCKMINCHFYDCNFSHIYMKKSNMIDSICSKNTVWLSSHIKQSKLIQSSFVYNNFSNTLWEKSSIENCNMKCAFFHKVTFKKIELDNVNFQKADFFQTFLKEIDFSTCDIEAIMVSDTYKELEGMKINAQQAVDIAKILEIEIV